MNSLFATPRPKRLCRFAARTLLLALPFGGIAFQLSPVQAQPTLPATPQKSAKPLSPEQKANIDKLLSLSKQERLCKKPLDFKIEDATLEDVIARVKPMFPQGAFAIEVRGARPVKVSFDLKPTRVGNVLNDVAALAGCKLFLLPNGLLIAPTAMLSEAEADDIKYQRGGKWGENNASGGSGWSNDDRADELFTRLIAQEATGNTAEDLPVGVTKTTFGDFSPESQSMLQGIAELLNDGIGRRPGSHSPIIHLDAASPVSVTISRSTAQRTFNGIPFGGTVNGIDIDFGPGTSNPGARSVGLGVHITR